MIQLTKYTNNETIALMKEMFKFRLALYFVTKVCILFHLPISLNWTRELRQLCCQNAMLCSSKAPTKSKILSVKNITNFLSNWKYSGNRVIQKKSIWNLWKLLFLETLFFHVCLEIASHACTKQPIHRCFRLWHKSQFMEIFGKRSINFCWKTWNLP